MEKRLWNGTCSVPFSLAFSWKEGRHWRRITYDDRWLYDWVWVSWTYDLCAFFLAKAFGVLSGTFGMSSCLSQGRKCSSKKTVQTLCAVSSALRSSVNDEWRASRWCESSSKSKSKSKMLNNLKLLERAWNNRNKLQPPTTTYRKLKKWRHSWQLETTTTESTTTQKQVVKNTSHNANTTQNIKKKQQQKQHKDRHIKTTSIFSTT